MSAKEYINHVRLCGLNNLEIWNKQLLDILEFLGELQNSKPRVKEELTKEIENMQKLREKTQAIIQENRSEIDQFKNILEKMKEGRCKQFLIDYVINLYTPNQILENYCYSDMTIVYKLKIQACKSLDKIMGDNSIIYPLRLARRGQKSILR